jgi:hypothetical protein
MELACNSSPCSIWALVGVSASIAAWRAFSIFSFDWAEACGASPTAAAD